MLIIVHTFFLSTRYRLLGDHSSYMHGNWEWAIVKLNNDSKNFDSTAEI